MSVWSRYPIVGYRSNGPFPASLYRATINERQYQIVPIYAAGRYRSRTKRVVWRLYEDGRGIGRPFNSARLAKAWAEAFAALGDDRRARSEFIRNGGQWCWDKEDEWREARR